MTPQQHASSLLSAKPGTLDPATERMVSALRAAQKAGREKSAFIEAGEEQLRVARLEVQRIQGRVDQLVESLWAEHEAAEAFEKGAGGRASTPDRLDTRIPPLPEAVVPFAAPVEDVRDEATDPEREPAGPNSFGGEDPPHAPSALSITSNAAYDN